jgi:hypothetical protein
MGNPAAAPLKVGGNWPSTVRRLPAEAVVAASPGSYAAARYGVRYTLNSALLGPAVAVVTVTVKAVLLDAGSGEDDHVASRSPRARRT